MSISVLTLPYPKDKWESDLMEAVVKLENALVDARVLLTSSKDLPRWEREQNARLEIITERAALVTKMGIYGRKKMLSILLEERMKEVQRYLDWFV